jgi:endonuclease YncB( thermonuclease family)
MSVSVLVALNNVVPFSRIAIFCAGAMHTLSSIAFLVLLVPAASAETIDGSASVIDGDTIEIHGERIRITDLDAPELNQTCLLRDGGTEWPCGRVAASTLSEWITRYPVTCEKRGTDNAGRWLARCNVYTIDVATWIAGNGWGYQIKTVAVRRSELGWLLRGPRGWAFGPVTS